MAADDIILPMEGFPPLRTLRRTMQEFTSDVLQQRFFHDRLSMGVLSGGLAVNGLNLALLGLRVHPTRFTLSRNDFTIQYRS